MDQRDRDYAIRTLLAEAGGESPEGMAAVANVIRNRMKSGKFGGTTASDVVTADNQFEPWNHAGTGKNNDPLRYSPSEERYQRAARIWDAVQSGQYDDPTGGATHFFSPKAQADMGRAVPSWAKSFKQTASLGGHTFYADPNAGVDKGEAIGAIQRHFRPALGDGEKLTPQERAYYQTHIDNLTGPGGVDNPDGSRSTVYSSVVNLGGREYIIPSIWGGKHHSEDEAIAHAKQIGLDKFPSYGTAQEALAREKYLHDFMEKDVLAFRRPTRGKPMLDDQTGGMGSPQGADRPMTISDFQAAIGGLRQPSYRPNLLGQLLFGQKGMQGFIQDKLPNGLLGGAAGGIAGLFGGGTGGGAQSGAAAPAPAGPPMNLPGATLGQPAAGGNLMASAFPGYNPLAGIAKAFANGTFGKPQGGAQPAMAPAPQMAAAPPPQQPQQVDPNLISMLFGGGTGGGMA